MEYMLRAQRQYWVHLHRGQRVHVIRYTEYILRGLKGVIWANLEEKARKSMSGFLGFLGARV